MKFVNISIDEFFKRIDVEEYQFYLKTLKANNIFNEISCDFSEITYSEVSVLRRCVVNSTLNDYFTIYKIIYKQTPESFLKGTVLEFFTSLKYIQHWIEKINHKEQQALESSSDDKWIQAGGDRLNIFGELGVMIRLAEQFGCTPQQIGDWRYNDVFTVLLWNNINNEIMKNYHHIKK